jgi:hypothetical protein
MPLFNAHWPLGSSEQIPGLRTPWRLIKTAYFTDSRNSLYLSSGLGMKLKGDTPNGYGKAVRAILEKIPSGVAVENSGKDGNAQPSFGAFNLAPADDAAFAAADYANGCSITKECGMGLTPTGYYQCAVAGGIDRVLGKRLGRTSLPPDADDMMELSREFCRLCGHFKEGHVIPEKLRPSLLDEKISGTWETIYTDWKRSKRRK